MDGHPTRHHADHYASLTLTEAAHLYLSHGLPPVPAWAVRDNGTCRCPRGATCERPGKHPRSVHVGPGPRDYSWKPLACATHTEIEQRFTSGGRYAVANLMLAIPEHVLVIDQDNDDGGRHALAALAERLGQLPATLSHDTPHGTHRIYRTPPGWTTRAWVGKDTRNPLPTGIDLRVPGQILMAPPSRVRAEGGLVPYGPVIYTAIADLPAAYLTAWTPPREPVRSRRALTPPPPGGIETIAAYMHARITGIAEDLAAREPGGRNTAIYTAALKIGSTLGVARFTRGAEPAVAAWTDQAAEDALMAAAEHNGYISDHSPAAARSAIRSGLRNGLRSPRSLSRFRSHTARPQPAQERPPPDAGVGGWTRRTPVSQEARELPAASEAESGQTALPGKWDRAASRDWRDIILWQNREELLHERLPSATHRAGPEAQ